MFPPFHCVFCNACLQLSKKKNLAWVGISVFVWRKRKLPFPALLLAVSIVNNDEIFHNPWHWYTCSSDQIRCFSKRARQKCLNYFKNDHQRKGVNIETNSSNHNKGMETGIMESLFTNWWSWKLCVTDTGNQIKRYESTCTGEKTNWWFAYCCKLGLPLTELKFSFDRYFNFENDI